MPPPRLLHVAQPTTAGVARVVADLVRDQTARGWDVSVACPSDGHLRVDVQAAGARWCPWSAGRDPGPSTFAETVSLRAIIRAVDPELVHLHSSKAGLAGRLALRGRRPTVFQPHAWSFLAVAGAVRTAAVTWERGAARWTDVIAVVSDDERRLGEDAGIRGCYERLRNGVDLRARSSASAADAAEARRALDLPAGPLAVVVGRLCRQKGQDLLLTSWPRVRAAVPDAQLALVGDGPDRELLAAAAGSGVSLVGDQRDVQPWLTAADVVVLPGRWEAGLTLVAMEAMATGRSVVTTAVAGMAEGLGPRTGPDGGAAGAVVAIDDGPALVSAIVARLADPALATSEGRAGRVRVEREYNLTVTTAAVADLYARLRRPAG